MDVALVRFVGAGITSVAAGLGVQVPQGAIEGGYNLVSYLLANNPDRTRGLIEGAVRELWTDWKRSGLPPKVASTHLEALPTLMDRHRPADDRFVGALAVAKTAIRSGPAAVMVPSRRIATSIVTAARESDSMPAEVSDAIALFFLERLYCHLLMERNALLELGPTLDAYFYKSLWRGRTYDPAVISAASGKSAEPAAAVEAKVDAKVEAKVDAPTNEAGPEAAVATRHGAVPPAPPVAERPSFLAGLKRTQAHGLARPHTSESAAKAASSAASSFKPAMSPPPAEPVEAVVEAPTAAPAPAPVEAPLRSGQPLFREPVAPPNPAPRLPRLRTLAVEPAPRAEAAVEADIVDAPASLDAADVVTVAVPDAPAAADITAPIAAALAEAPIVAEPQPRDEPQSRDGPMPAAEALPAIESAPTAKDEIVTHTSPTAAPLPADPPAATALPPMPRDTAVAAPMPAPQDAPLTIAEPKLDPVAEVAAVLPIEAAPADVPAPSGAPAPVDELENDPLVLEISERTGAPARVVAALADDLMSNGDGSPLDEAQLVAACTAAATLLETMRTASGRAPAAQAHRTEALLALGDGNLDGCDRALAMAEDEELKAAQRDISASRLHLSQASATRGLRAELAKVRGDLRVAARHYAVGARCLSPLDRAGRWDMLWAQTRVLVDLAHKRDGAPVLLEAVDTLRQAVGVIGQREAALEWAQAHKRIAELLLEAQMADGQRSHAVEAIEHVDQAIDVLSRARATDAWADAQILKGMALQRLALCDEGRHNLDQAIEAFRSALGPLSASRTPVAQARALARLGLALKDLGERAEDTGAYVEAITQLRAAADLDEDVLRKAGFEVGEIAVATAGAIAALSGARRDPDLLTGAVTELRRAAQLMANAEARPLADVEEQLSGTLERLGRHRRDPAMLQEAARVKLAAHDRHEKLGHRQIADRLRDELEALHDHMARLAADAGGKPNVYARAG